MGTASLIVETGFCSRQSCVKSKMQFLLLSITFSNALDWMLNAASQFPVVNARTLDFPPTPGSLFMVDPAGVREQWQLAPHSGFLHGPTGSGGLRPPFIYRPAGGHSSNRLWNAPSAGIADGGCNPPLPVFNLRAKTRRARA